MSVVIARYKYPNGFTVHFLGDGYSIRTMAALADGSHVATAGRLAGAESFEGKTADAAFERALACVREWRSL